MSHLIASSTSIGRTYSKATLINGKPAKIKCIDIDKQTYVINRGPLSVA